MYPSDCLYTEAHEWIRIKDDLCVLGLTDFAQNELGEVVYVEVPEVGETYEAGDEIGTIESVKAVAEIYTPVSGEIVEVNAGLEDSPNFVNDDPHGGGWLVKLRFSPDDDLSGLMDATRYEEYVKAQE
ncbi:MAG: glycine cleavage system protein GcvH [bacterium]|nr:glycine cleavage system protein GcvH [bacterium]